MKKERIYPDKPDQHMMKQWVKKNRVLVDENYRYESKNPFYRLYSTLIWLFAHLAIPIWGKLWVRHKIKGRKNLRGLRRQSVIFVANHVHVMDAPLICASTTRSKKVRIVSLSENANIPVASHFLKCLGLVPLGDTFGGMRNFNNHINELIDKRKNILFFPEAALWSYYEGLRPFHKGAFVFSAKRNVPVVPMVYTFQKKPHRRVRLVLNIGKPIYPEGRTAEELAEIAYRHFEGTMEKIYDRPVIKPSVSTVEDKAA